MKLSKELIEVSGTYPKMDIIDHGGWGSRHESFITLLNEMFRRYESHFINKNLHFVFYSGDRAEHAQKYLRLGPVLSNCTTEKLKNRIHPIPDFLYNHGREVGIPEWAAITKQCEASGSLPYEKNQCFWIGDANNHRIRKKILSLSIREPKHLQAIGMEWAYNHSKSGPGPDDGIDSASDYVTLPDHANYKYLLDVQGIGYSSRLKILLHLKRPVFVVDRDYQEFFHPHLIPYKHYVPVKRDLSDLISQIKWLDNDEEAYRMIVKETERFSAEYLSKDYALEHLFRTILKHTIS